MKISRRNVLAVSASAPVLAGFPASAAPQGILIVMDADNQHVHSPAVAHALDQLRRALMERGAGLDAAFGNAVPAGATFAVVLAAPGAALASSFPSRRAASTVPEQFQIVPGNWSGMSALLVSARTQGISSLTVAAPCARGPDRPRQQGGGHRTR